MSNQELEQGLREEWKQWQTNAHPDDRMSFIDYAGEVGTFKGHRVILERDRYGDVEIEFHPIPCSHKNTYTSASHTSGISIIRCKDCNQVVN